MQSQWCAGSASSRILAVLVLSFGLANAARTAGPSGSGWRAEGTPVRSVERLAAHRLAVLDERLGLGTFPDGSGPWTARLAAALEYRLDDPHAAGAFSPHLMSRLADDLRQLGIDRALDPPPPAGASPRAARVERVRRILATVRLLETKLDLWERAPDREEGSLSPRAAPANDDCAAATSIGLGTVSGSTASATGDGSASCGASDGAPDVWFRFTPAAAGVFTFDTFGSSFDTVLSVLTGCPQDGRGEEIACNDDSGGTVQSAVTLGLSGGQEVRIRVSGSGGAAGSFQLGVRRVRAISGTLTRQDTGAPVAGGTVKLYDSGNNLVDQVVSGADGDYLFDALQDGTYFVLAEADGMIRELYEDVACPFFSSCTPAAAGTSIDVSGNVVTGIDLVLAPAGAISGVVADAGTGDPLSAFVDLYSDSGSFLHSVATGPDGTYAITDLPAGTFYLSADAADHRSEVYDDLPCDGSCDVTAGAPLTVAVGETLSGIDFALDRPGAISGTVIEDATGDPLSEATVSVFDDAGDFVARGYSQTDGSYRVGALSAGTYFVIAATNNLFAVVEYEAQLYEAIPCPDTCDVTTGTPVSVALNATTDAIDFALLRRGSIAGTVTATSSGAPVSGARLHAYDDAGFLRLSATTDSGGGYTLQSLPSGDYTVLAVSDLHQDEVYDDIPCPQPCEPAVGDPLTVAAATSTTGIDFQLTPYGTVAGTVTDAVTGDPLRGVTVAAVEPGVGGESTSTAADGSYEVAVPPGGYAVKTFNPGGDHRDEIWDDVPCPPDCDLASGTTLEVPLDTAVSGIDFALDRYGVIEGRILEAGTGAKGADLVSVLPTEGGEGKTELVSFSGDFVIRGILPGVYAVRTGELSYKDVHQDELYDNVPCEPSCDVSQGVQIPIALNTTVLGVDFVVAVCPADSFNQILGTTFLGSHTEEACEQVTAGGGTTVASGADVTFKAGRRVVLRDGFSVESGAGFRVVIEPSWTTDE